ncbi:50S ribosomal protein L10 [Candidatus Falkowbacteria bacterium]|jgi:large subunit ribosomal protein L10|nr:50S ribosomal protein L10 [Candidatus Falkowbacteria bacterium]MBT7006886.1 50S ribosomal protein L10 [Candidatus Falkowbacteria bacterium]
MAKTKQQKEEIIKTLVGRIQNAKLAVLTDLEGLTVNDSQELRDKCKENQIELISAKKTLIQKALEESKVEGLDIKALKGSISVVTSQDDEVTPAKIIKDFSKDHESVVFRAGVLEGKIVDEATLKQLASLPSKEELLAKMVGSLNAPISGFVNVLAGNLRNLVNVLNAIKDNK